MMDYRKRVLKLLVNCSNDIRLWAQAKHVNCINDIRLWAQGKHHKRPVNVVKTKQTASETEVLMLSIY